MKRTTPPTFLAVSSIFVGACGLAGVLPALFSAMVFDAPGSQDNPATNLLFWSAFTFPIVCAVVVLIAWSLHFAKWMEAAKWIMWLPLINIALGVIAIIWLEVAYNGQFNG